MSSAGIPFDSASTFSEPETFSSDNITIGIPSDVSFSDPGNKHNGISGDLDAGFSSLGTFVF